MPFEDGASSVPDSGLTGSPDLPDELPGEERRPSRTERLSRWWRTAGAVVRTLPQVLRLAWQAGPWLTVGMAAATVVGGALPAAVAYLTKLLLDTVVEAIRLHAQGAPDHVVLSLPFLTTRTTSAGKLVGLAAVQLLVSVVGTAFASLSQTCRQLLQERLSQILQYRIMDHASRLDQVFFEGSASYDLLRQAQEEAPTRPMFLISGVFDLLQALGTFAGMIGLLARMNPWLALIALLAPVPAFVSQARYSGRGFLVALWGAPVKRRMHYLSTLVTTDTHAKEVKTFGLGGYFVERFRLLGLAWYGRLRKVMVRRQLMAAGWGSLTALTGSLTYLYTALQAVAGHLTLGDLTLYTQAAGSVQGSVQGMFNNFSEMYENSLYLTRVYELLAVPATIRRPANPVPLPRPLRGEIVFEHVSFAYPGSAAPALDDVSFRIEPGRTVAVVGRNGAGKSTLLKLLCRLYEPTAGRILVDGIDIREVDPDELRSRMGAMFQDFVTYQATVAENIGLGDLDHLEDLPRIEESARQAGAAEVIGRLPGKFGTPLGRWFDEGVNLSGGEWQKIALSRAFMRDAAILLLDEPTSALDAEAEYDLFERLHRLARGRTTLYISHRFSTVRQADRILLLDHGRLAEEGSHEELMGRAGDYAELFSLQAAAYLDDGADGRPGDRVATPAADRG
ncbi:ABC transporter ATP-binding protein [Kitasatospora sp. NPDC056138]|uniref:ABC transporter ATP-binding protein n=1 Tax=Kitasatospora sp. NPDC056138 TaxID=3345724 RepID=UPI0035E23B73